MLRQSEELHYIAGKIVAITAREPYGSGFYFLACSKVCALYVIVVVVALR
jgi:hypothetical protein